MNLLQEYLGLLEPTWGLARINIPGLVSPANWSYRYPLTLEKLSENKALLSTLQGLLHP